jgi:CubicO group peptidase (beta-lactamase class C family)
MNMSRWFRRVVPLCAVVTACSSTGRAIVQQPVEPGCTPLPNGSPESVGITQATIDSIQRAAVAMKSDALVIVRDGKVVHEWRDPAFRDTVFNIQSVTKAIASLGVGLLADDGRLTSYDLPVRELLPEFATPERAPITLRMLMHHTSGLAAGRGEAQFYETKDVHAYVRTRPVTEPAGTVYRYNNVGAQLVSHVVQAKAGMPLAKLVGERVLRPLCIGSWAWDAEPDGTTWGYSRLHLRARDLAAIGQLVVDTGVWNGRRILSAATLDSLTHRAGARGLPLSASSHALTWQWVGFDSVRVDNALLARMRAAGAPDALVTGVQRLAGPGASATLTTARFKAALDTLYALPRDSVMMRWYRDTRGAADPERWRGPAQVIYHSGSWGQWLLVFPETRTVVVRYASWTHKGRRSEEDGYGWGSIYADLYRLIGSKRVTR